MLASADGGSVLCATGFCPVRHVVAILLAAVLCCASLAGPGATLAYTYLGTCAGGSGYQTNDIVQDLTSNQNGAEMSLYHIVAGGDWDTCHYSGSGYGHMDELLSIQGTGNNMAQLGIAKYAGSGGYSWIFIYTQVDNSGGVVVSADSLFGEDPIAGDSYWFHILRTSSNWQYCIKNLTDGRQVCWTTAASWSTAGFVWYGGETINLNDTMGAHPEASTFRTYGMRHHTSSGWAAYLGDGFLIGNCYQWGSNATIENCNILDVESTGGIFIWTQ